MRMLDSLVDFLGLKSEAERCGEAFEAAEKKFSKLYDSLDRQGRLNFEEDKDSSVSRHCKFSLRPEKLELYQGKDFRKLIPKRAAYMEIHFNYCSGCSTFATVVAETKSFWYKAKQKSF